MPVQCHYSVQYIPKILLQIDTDTETALPEMQFKHIVTLAMDKNRLVRND